MVLSLFNYTQIQEHSRSLNLILSNEVDLQTSLKMFLCLGVVLLLQIKVTDAVKDVCDRVVVARGSGDVQSFVQIQQRTSVITNLGINLTQCCIHSSQVICVV